MPHILSNNKQVFVKTLFEKTITLNITDNDSVLMLKTKIQEKTGDHHSQQYLSFAGKPLIDILSIAEYNSQKESTLYLLPLIKGGAKDDTYDPYNCRDTSFSDGIGEKNQSSSKRQRNSATNNYSYLFLNQQYEEVIFTHPNRSNNEEQVMLMALWPPKGSVYNKPYDNRTSRSLINNGNSHFL